MDVKRTHAATHPRRYRFITTADREMILQIGKLYQDAGWGAPEQGDGTVVRRLIQGSHCFLVVQQGAQVIGMGRAISDGASDAYIQDVTVRSDFRGHGVGRGIVARLTQRLAADGIQWIGLIAENNSRDFYTPMGFSPMPNACPMVKIVS